MISCQRISKHFFQHPVLERIQFEVDEGKSFVILGQSGVGKSVLLKILAGLILPDEGHVRIQSRNIGMLFQKNALFDSLSVQDNLEFPLQERSTLARPARLEKIEKFLDWVGLKGTNTLFPDELSGGMQKRLGIARALIVEPKVLFYDEPTAGLDPITSRIIAELILRLKQEFGTTIVSVTSDVMRAYQLADHIGLLVNGRNGAQLVHAGTPAEAKVSKDPAVNQFLKGLTQGPLTSGQNDVLQTPRSPFEDCGYSITERMDVDFF